MKGLDTGRDKIQKICDLLTKETIEPAKQEAREIVENAHMQAAQIVQEAKERGERLLQEAKEEMEEKRRVFLASLQLAARQGVELFQEKVEEALFTRGLQEILVREMKDPKVVARCIEAILRSIEEGLCVAQIPKEVSPRAINALLGEAILERLEKESVVVGDFLGGAVVSLRGKDVTIDVSSEAVQELLSRFIRKDFRDLFFVS